MALAEERGAREVIELLKDALLCCEPSKRINLANRSKCGPSLFFRDKLFEVLCLCSCFPVSKEVGDVFKRIGDSFCIEFACGNG